MRRRAKHLVVVGRPRQHENGRGGEAEEERRLPARSSRGSCRTTRAAPGSSPSVTWTSVAPRAAPCCELEASHLRRQQAIARHREIDARGNEQHGGEAAGDRNHHHDRQQPARGFAKEPGADRRDERLIGGGRSGRRQPQERERDQHVDHGDQRDAANQRRRQRAPRIDRLRRSSCRDPTSRRRRRTPRSSPPPSAAPAGIDTGEALVRAPRDRHQPRSRPITSSSATMASFASAVHRITRAPAPMPR